MSAVLSRSMRRILGAAVLAALTSPVAHGVSLTITNHGFEDGPTAQQFAFNEFVFGAPNGWSAYDPGGIAGNLQGSSGVFYGTLEPGFPGGGAYFGGNAPEGDKVAILFNSANKGAGEYGLSQALSDVLTANTRYELSVAVGNIVSGNTLSGDFFNLSGFPGYRIELLAGSTVIAFDDNSLGGSIAEDSFAVVTLALDVGALHANLGQSLAIRLINLNMVGSGMNDPDIEVDFDNVQLRVTALAQPESFTLLAFGLLCMVIGFAATARPASDARAPGNARAID